MPRTRRGPGRPARDDVRAAVLEAAREAFVRDGVENVTVADLLEASGVSRATFYKHFEGRDDVLAELYRDAVAAARADVLRSMSDARDIFDILERGTAAYVTALLRRGRLSLEFAKLYQAIPKMQAARDEVVRGYVDMIQMLQQVTGQPPVPAYLLDAFLAGIERLGQTLAAEQPDAPPEEAVGRMMDEIREAVRSYTSVVLARTGR